MKDNSLRNRMMARMAQMMASCNEASYLASKSLDTKLSIRERLNLRIHVMTCKFCLMYVKDMKALDHYMKNEMGQANHRHLHADEKERINKRLIEKI